jgi:hypothetical protein
VAIEGDRHLRQHLEEPIMVIRRIVGSALAVAALAGAVGILAAPDAAARPKSCAALVNATDSWQNEWLYDVHQYGANDKITLATRAVYQNYINKSVAAGC